MLPNVEMGAPLTFAKLVGLWAAIALGLWVRWVASTATTREIRLVSAKMDNADVFCLAPRHEKKTPIVIRWVPPSLGSPIASRNADLFTASGLAVIDIGSATAPTAGMLGPLLETIRGADGLDATRTAWVVPVPWSDEAVALAETVPSLRPQVIVVINDPKERAALQSSSKAHEAYHEPRQIPRPGGCTLIEVGIGKGKVIYSSDSQSISEPNIFSHLFPTVISSTDIPTHQRCLTRLVATFLQQRFGSQISRHDDHAGSGSVGLWVSFLTAVAAITFARSIWSWTNGWRTAVTLGLGFLAPWMIRTAVGSLPATPQAMPLFKPFVRQPAVAEDMRFLAERGALADISFRRAEELLQNTRLASRRAFPDLGDADYRSYVIAPVIDDRSTEWQLRERVWKLCHRRFAAGSVNFAGRSACFFDELFFLHPEAFAASRKIDADADAANLKVMPASMVLIGLRALGLPARRAPSGDAEIFLRGRWVGLEACPMQKAGNRLPD